MRLGNRFRLIGINHEWTRIDTNEDQGHTNELANGFVFIRVHSWLKQLRHFADGPLRLSL
jgi:hypothetical protein